MPMTLRVPCPPFLNTLPVSTSAVKIGSPRAGRFAKRGDYRESHCVRLVRFPLISADSRLARETPAVFSESSVRRR